MLLEWGRRLLRPQQEERGMEKMELRWGESRWFVEQFYRSSGHLTHILAHTEMER
jgi:hypothetical protein